MTRTVSFIIFFSIASGIIFSIHYYLWLKIIKNPVLKGNYKIIGTCLLIMLAVSFPLSNAIARFVPFKYSFPILWISCLWLGMMMLLFFAFCFTDCVKMIMYLFTKFTTSGEGLSNPGRREFMSKVFASGVSTIVFGASAVGIKNYYTEAIVKTIKISILDLPKIFKNFKIIQISDLHIGQMMTAATLKKIVNKVNKLNPDLVVITGDIVDGSAKNLLNEIIFLKELKAKKGVYFVTGNHEYYSGVRRWTYEIKKMGIKVLNNENVKIKENEEFFYLAGITDSESRRHDKKNSTNINKALAGLEINKKKILLAHRPTEVEQASEYGVDLVLAGHTHGGQIWPFSYLVALQQPYLKGYYKYKNTNLYVNQGTGCWGPPLRLNTFNEITEIILI